MYKSNAVYIVTIELELADLLCVADAKIRGGYTTIYLALITLA